MVLLILETGPAGSKPPAADVEVRIFMVERHDFGASVPSSTRASSLHIDFAEAV